MVLRRVTASGGSAGACQSRLLSGPGRNATLALAGSSLTTAAVADDEAVVQKFYDWMRRRCSTACSQLARVPGRARAALD